VKDYSIIKNRKTKQIPERTSLHCSGRYGKRHPFMICHKMLIASIGLKNKNRPTKVLQMFHSLLFK
jgi:hypothetical protein